MENILQKCVNELLMAENILKKREDLVTVAITTRDRPDTLHQALNSVIRQSYKNLEILVLDDCSVGVETKNLVQRFIKIDKRIKYHRHEKNIGINPNFNFALSQSHGKYFTWLCDDDWIDQNYINSCLSTLIANNDYALVTGKTKFCWQNEFAYDGVEINILENSKSNRWLSFYVRVLGSGNPPNFGLIELDKIRKFLMPNVMGCDYILFSKVAYMGKIKTLNDVYIHRRLGGMSETMEKMAVNFSLPKFDKEFGFVSLWINIFKDLFFDSSFHELNLFRKMSLAFKLNLLIWFNMLGYIRAYRMRRVKTQTHLS